MKTFDAYVQDANRLCKDMLGAGDVDTAKKKLTCMQERISHSRLTVYQKDSLIQQLRSTSEDLLMRKMWNMIAKDQDMFY